MNKTPDFRLRAKSVFFSLQLSKRVEILQSELDDYERKGSKPSKVKIMFFVIPFLSSFFSISLSPAPCL